MQPTSDRYRSKIGHVGMQYKGLAVNIILLFLPFKNMNVCKMYLIYVALIVVNVICGEFSSINGLLV